MRHHEGSCSRSPRAPRQPDRGGPLSLHDTPRNGLTVLELLVVMSIIAVLVAIFLPAISSAREAARRVECVNNLKQIGLALHSYHEVAGAFPAGWEWERSQHSAYGWAVPLLPYLELESLLDRIHRDRVLTDPANAAVRRVSIGTLLCPSDLHEQTFMLASDSELSHSSRQLFELPTANYFGVFGIAEPDEQDPLNPIVGEGTFIESRPVRMAELQRGASNTLLIGERTMARVPSTWLGVDRFGADSACRLVGNALTAPNCEACDECEFDSRHRGGANFLWGDGRVTLVPDSIDSQLYQRLSRRSEF